MRIFNDPMTTMAAIDRVVHHPVILDLMGVESYRAKEWSNHQQDDAQVGEADQSSPVAKHRQPSAV